MQKNKFTTYLLYATGEIVLVVIGILIAVSLNNWNRERQASELSINYLQDVTSELENDIKNWSERKESNEVKIANIDETVLGLRSKEVTIDRQFIAKMQRSFTNGPVTVNRTTYDDLVSSGNMGNIKPQKLRQSIIRHYNEIDGFIEHSKREYDYVWNHFLPFFNNNGYFDWSQNISGIGRGSTQTESFINERIGSREFKALENNLLFRKITLSSQNENIGESIQDTENLIQKIQNQLK